MFGGSSGKIGCLGMTDGQWASHVNAIDTTLVAHLALLWEGGADLSFQRALDGLGEFALVGGAFVPGTTLYQLPLSAAFLHRLLTTKRAEAEQARVAAQQARDKAAAEAAAAAAHIADLTEQLRQFRLKEDASSTTPTFGGAGSS
jgi:hypothetical protein